MRSRSKSSKRSKLQRHKRYTKRRLTKRRPSKRRPTKRRLNKRRPSKRKLTKNFQDINKIKYKTKKNKKIKKSLKYGGSNFSLFNCIQINKLLNMGLTLRLVRHGLPNSKSGIDWVAKKYPYKKLSKRQLLDWARNTNPPREPTLYFDDKFDAISSDQIKDHRLKKIKVMAATLIQARVRDVNARRQVQGQKERLHGGSPSLSAPPQLFAFPVKAKPVEANPVEVSINLVVFVSPFLRTLETMLEMMASAIINIRSIIPGVNLVIHIDIIVGPFTELIGWKESYTLLHGNRFHETTTTRFSYLLTNFKDIYLEGLKDVDIIFDLQVCAGTDMKNLSIVKINLISQRPPSPADDLDSLNSTSSQTQVTDQRVVAQQQLFTDRCQEEIYTVSESNTKSGKGMDLFLCLDKVLKLDGIEALVKEDYFEELRVVTHSKRVKYLFTSGTGGDPEKKINFFESLCIRKIFNIRHANILDLRRPEFAKQWSIPFTYNTSGKVVEGYDFPTDYDFTTEYEVKLVPSNTLYGKPAYELFL